MAPARGFSLERPIVGDSVGRYTVLSQLGSGGMGFVLAAYDPELDRRVALKLLKRNAASKEGTRRLQREAQALARLSHPNVVTVYEVGVHSGETFIAMEFIRGQTLRDWLEQEPRTWQAIRTVFLDAGRGLAAAHAAALIHRDFKPDNVMVGDDGRVLVMDFGIVRWNELDPQGDTDPELELIPPATRPATQPDLRLTHTSTVLGTPGYIAPELIRGAGVDARADQYAFCVALHEALSGERLRSNDTPATPAEVPAWLMRVVERGRARDRSRRYASMNELLEQLERDPQRKRRRVFASVAVAGALLGSAWLGSSLGLPPPEATPQCTDGALEVQELWGPLRRQGIRAALHATGRAQAEAVWQRVERGLDTYVDEWTAARRSSCEASAIGLQSPDLASLREACLTHRLTELRGLVDALEQATPETTQRAVEAVLNLSSVASCSDVDALTRANAGLEDPGYAHAVEVLAKRRAELGARMEVLGTTDDDAALDALVSEARDLGYAPELTRLLLLRAGLHERRGELDSARADLLDSYELALDNELFDLAFDSAHRMRGFEGLAPEPQIAWGTRAELLLELIDDPVRGVDFLVRSASLAMRRGELDEAARVLTEAHELRARGGDVNPITTALLDLATAQHRFVSGEPQLALELFARVHADLEGHVGPYHPLLVKTLISHAQALIQTKNYDRARELLESLVSAIDARELSVSLYIHSVLHSTLGNIENSVGNLEKARHHYRIDLELTAEQFGERDPYYALTLNNLGNVELGLGNYQASRDHQLDALAILDASLEANPGLVIPVLTSLGYSEQMLGHTQIALEAYERALELPSFASSSRIDQARVHTSLAEVLWEVGQHERALDHGQAAFDLYSRSPIDPEGVAKIESWLAAHAR